MVKREMIFGIPILAGGREDMLSEILGLVDVGGVVATLNPEIMARTVENEELRRVLMRSTNVPDGIGVVKELSARGIYSALYPGVELGEDILKARPVRLGIIGIGNMGTAHAKSLNEGKVEGMRLTAVCDIDQSRLDWCKENLSDRLQVKKNYAILTESHCYSTKQMVNKK